MMTPRELVYKALAFEDVPRVPYCIDFCVPARDNLCATAEGKKLFDGVRNDMTMSVVLGIEAEVRDGADEYVDEFGVVWDRSVDVDIGCPRPCLTPDSFSRHRWPDPAAEGRFDVLAENLARNGDTFNLMAFGFSLFERAWSLRGMENLLLDFIDRPDFAAALLDKITDLNLAIMAEGFRRFPTIDGVYFGDDFGCQRGLIMGAARWRETLKPRLAKLYGAAGAAGKKVVIHSCGKVQEIFDDLIEIGLDCFNPFQPEVMDVYQMARRYHGNKAFWGGVSTQRLLPYASVPEVEQEVGKLLEMGRRGGYIISPAHAIPGDAKTENIAAMLRVILGQCPTG